MELDLLKLFWVTFICLASQRGEIAAASDGQIIPPSFPDQDISQYTVLYISNDGNDYESCRDRTNPPYSTDLNLNTIQYCRSLSFALGINSTNKNIIGRKNITILFLPGEHSLGSVGVKLVDSQNIIFSKMPGTTGEAVLYCEMEYNETDYNNIFANNTTNLAIQGLVITRCGPKSAPLVVFRSSNIVVTNCVWRNNTNSLILRNTRQVEFTNCIFHDNNSTVFYDRTTDVLDPGEQLRIAGGLAFLWRNMNSDLPTVQVTIRNCTFLNNHANIDAQNIDDTRPNLYIPRGHGGGIVVFFDRTVNYTVVIEDTTFSNNTARYYGGGIFVSFYRNSFSNTVRINNSRFEGNKCNSAGGGISMNTFEGSDGNVMIVENCSFFNNTASIGGGAFSISLQDQLVAQMENLRNNTARFSNCTFISNESPSGGSAVSLVANSRVDQAVVSTTFTNCSFLSNLASENQSAIWSFRYPISFRGTNIIKNNTGSGIALLQSIIEAKGSIWFEGNIAVEGGAIALRDQSVIHLLSNVNMTFIGNNATTRGGAISVETPTVGIDTDVIRLFNIRCFIQYEFDRVSVSTGPAEWNATLVFINNTAVRDGAAIYATDIGRCTYAPSLNEGGNITYNRSIFQVSPLFNFSGNRVLDNSSNNIIVEDIGTAPSNLIITPNVVSGAPGERLTFRISAVDESGNLKQAVWSINDHNEDEPEDSEDENFRSLSAGGNNHTYDVEPLKQSSLYLNCSDGINRTIDFSLVQVIAGGVSSVSSVQLNLTCCHPAYYFNEASGKCELNHSISIVVRPDPPRRYVYITPDTYAEVRDGNVMVSAVMPSTFQNCSRVGTLSGCLFKYDSPYEQCSHNRTGFLCGKCPEGKGVDLTLRQCTDCTVFAAIFVAVLVIILSVLSILVLIFNIGIPNELKGCLFYVQVVGFIYNNQTDSIAWDFHLSRVFGFSFYLPLCPYPGYSALATTAYGLLLPIIAVAILVAYIISARFIRHLSHRSSFEGIWLLSIITYKYLADTCFNILRCQRVEGAPGEYVFYYDGTIRCFDSVKHIGFAVFALVLGVFVILLFPLIIFLISYERFKLTIPFTDVLTKGIKSSYRWWSSFDLFRRLLFIFVVFIFNYANPAYIQLALFFAGLFVFFVFACTKPYEKMMVNFIEMVILLDLLLLTALFLDTNTHNLNAVLPFAQTLLLLPFISLVLYFGVVVFRKIWKRVSPTGFMMCAMRVRDLFHGSFIKQHPALSHNLEVKEDKTELLRSAHRDSKDQDGVLPDELAEFQAEYSAFREELLEDDT